MEVPLLPRHTHEIGVLADAIVAWRPGSDTQWYRNVLQNPAIRIDACGFDDAFSLRRCAQVVVLRIPPSSLSTNAILLNELVIVQSYNQMLGSFLPSLVWFAVTKSTQVEGADIVMKSLGTTFSPRSW